MEDYLERCARSILRYIKGLKEIQTQFKEEEPENWTDVPKKWIKGEIAAGASIMEGGASRSRSSSWN